ncbi:A24 family peptidase [Arsenophonus sp. ENCA]|uniref:prepilin peptidase n=1 Tax=Arsenophonus sp. ENCA TaxID=1987579 RepID=UPI0025BED7BE|nr:A24 family peptidase [Arsenophonus sp. ENCA]
MSALSLVLLGLCAVIVQSSVVGVARYFLDVHQERPLSVIGRSVIVTRVIFTGLSFLSAIFSTSALQGLLALVFLAFLSLFIYLDAASRCLPRCFTLAFGLTGAVWHFLLYPETALPALLTALSLFGVLWALRTLAYRRDGGAQCGLGDVYLMAGLGMWFAFPTVFWVISAAAVSGGLFLLARRLCQPMQWQENVNYRSAPFAPFLCGVAAIDHLWLMGSYL